MAKEKLVKDESLLVLAHQRQEGLLPVGHPEVLVRAPGDEFHRALSVFEPVLRLPRFRATR